MKQTEADIGCGLILAIETAVEAGSLALFRDGAPIGGWVGGGNSSRSEEVLAAIKNLLDESGATVSEINSIIVSNGPGSFTGARVGAAIAKGLSKSIGCRSSACSVLEAMAETAFRFCRGSWGEANKIVLAAIPFGKKAVCLQHFTFGGDGRITHRQEPAAAERASFADCFEAGGFDSAILHETLYSELCGGDRKNEIKQSGVIVTANRNLAVLIGESALSYTHCEELTTRKISPMYVQNF